MRRNGHRRKIARQAPRFFIARFSVTQSEAKPATHPYGFAETKTDAGGNIAMDMMAKGPNDGSLLLLVEVNAQLVVNNTLFKNVSNDPVRDLSPVSMAVRASHFPVTHPPLPVRNVQEFIADVKANHGFLYASVGLGGASHRTMEMFRFVNEAIRSSPAFYAQMLRKVPGKVFGLARSGLGFSGGAALGVQLAHSNRMVVQVTGDGSHYYDNPEALYGVAQPKRVPVFSMILDCWRRPKIDPSVRVVPVQI